MDIGLILAVIVFFIIIIIAMIAWDRERKEKQEDHQINIESAKMEILQKEQDYRHGIGQPFHPKKLNHEDD